jgi:hypothetical protein
MFLMQRTTLGVSILLLSAIAYCVWTSQWLPAIFALLARKELLNYLDEVCARMERNQRRINDSHLL